VAVSTIITLGYGSFGSIAEVVTLGYGSAEVTIGQFPIRIGTIHGSERRHGIEGEERRRKINGSDKRHEVSQ
jgi:hypothetical protein